MNASSESERVYRLPKQSSFFLFGWIKMRHIPTFHTRGDDLHDVTPSVSLRLPSTHTMSKVFLKAWRRQEFPHSIDPLPSLSRGLAESTLCPKFVAFPTF